MEEEQPLFRQLIRASTLGIHLVSATVVGGAIGYFLDKFFGTKPWLLLVFFFVGIGTGFRDLFRMIEKEEKSNTHDGLPGNDSPSDRTASGDIGASPLPDAEDPGRSPRENGVSDDEPLL